MTKIHQAFPHLVNLPAFNLAEPKPPASLVLPRIKPHRYTDEVRNHTELASRIADARAFERLTGIKTPNAIEQIIQSWELGL